MKKTKMMVLGSIVAMAAALVIACGDGAAGMQPPGGSGVGDPNVYFVNAINDAFGLYAETDYQGMPGKEHGDVYAPTGAFAALRTAFEEAYGIAGELNLTTEAKPSIRVFSSAFVAFNGSNSNGNNNDSDPLPDVGEALTTINNAIDAFTGTFRTFCECDACQCVTGECACAVADYCDDPQGDVCTCTCDDPACEVDCYCDYVDYCIGDDLCPLCDECDASCSHCTNDDECVDGDPCVCS